MFTKEQFPLIIADLPAEFSIDELMDKLILIEKIRDAMQQGERGETYSTAEAKRLFKLSI